MLVPHSREHAELGVARLAPHQLEDLVVFLGLEPVGGDEIGGDLGFVGDHVSFVCCKKGAVDGDGDGVENDKKSEQPGHIDSDLAVAIGAGIEHGIGVFAGDRAADEDVDQVDQREGEQCDDRLPFQRAVRFQTANQTR